MKKIFALVLSLCMVLSTFVAVSAQEQVYNEGVWNEGTSTLVIPGTSTTYFDVAEDFENGMGDALAGVASKVTVSAGTEATKGNVMVIDSLTTSTAHDGVAGFAVTSPDGVQYTQQTFPKAGTITYSFDVMINDVSYTTGPSFFMRTNATFPPSGNMYNLNTSWGLESGVWKTISGTIDAANVTWTTNASNNLNVWLVFRPNFNNADGMMYIDNVSFKCEYNTEDTTKYVEYIVNSTEEFATDAGSVQVGNTAISGTVQNGALVATATAGTGAYGIVGLPVVNTAGEAVKVRNLDGDATIEWSVDVMFPDASKVSSGYIMLRDGNFVPTNDLVALKYFSSLGLQNNEWKTISGKCKLSELGWSELKTGNTFFAVRPNFSAAGTMYVDNMSIKIYNEVAPEDVREPGWEVEPGWTAPDYSIDYTTQKALNNIGTIDANGDFTADIDDVEAHNNGAGNCSYQPWIWLNTSIPAGKQFVVSYDFTSEGINNSVGNPYDTLTVRTRFYNASGSEINSGYRPSAALTANTGEPVHYELNVDTAQLTQDIASVRLVVDVDVATKYKLNDDGAYFKLSNIAIMDPNTKVALSAAKTANGVDLTLANNNAEDYKFSGRLLIAEYKTVDGVKELVQFAEVAVDEVIEAGSDAVVTAEFEENITAGNQVYVFVWEPASFDAITMFIK